MTGGRRRDVRAVLDASWWLVRRPGLLIPVALALALAAAMASLLDDGWGLRVLRWVGVLLACGLVATTDDPSGEVLAASPYPRAVRTTARVVAGATVVVSAWGAIAVLVQWRSPDVPVLGLGVEALAFCLLGVSVGAGLRAWRDVHMPAYLAALGTVGLAFATNVPPRWYTLQQGQTWGPPWEAAQYRWLGLLLVAVGIVGLALRDPLAGHRDDRGRRRSLLRYAGAPGAEPSACPAPSAPGSTSPVS